MADVKALRRNRVSNPDPPSPGVQSNNLERQPRNQEGREETVALQLKLPVSVYEQFSAQAGREFGYKKGAKVNLFLKIWKEYASRLET